MKSNARNASQDHDPESRRNLDRVAAASPRATLAISALSTAIWFKKRWSALCNRFTSPGLQEVRLRVEPKPDTHRGTIYSSAAVLLFALTCPALRAQQPAASAPGTGTGPQPANYSAKTLEAPGKPASPTSQADTLRQLNERLLEAHDVADVPTLDRIENDDFTLSGDFGTVTKQEHLDHVRKVGGQPQPVDREITPQQIRIYGDGAPITETDHASGSGGKSEYQTKSMWVRSGKNWRIVHMHYSKLAEKPGP